MRKSASTLPDTFKHNEEEITDPVEIANKFNEYFTNVGPNLASIIQIFYDQNSLPRKFLY